MFTYEDSQNIPQQKADADYAPHKSSDNIATNEEPRIRS